MITCSRHNGDPISVYSLKNERCMCLKCAMSEHVHLTDFVPLSEGAILVRDLGNQLVEELYALGNDTRVLQRERAKNLERLQVSERAVRSSIKNVRLKLNRHLDILEQKVLTKVKNYAENSENAFLKDKSELQILESEFRKMSDRLSQVLKAGNEVELIDGVIREKHGVKHKQNEMKRQETRNQNRTLHFDMSQTVAAFIENVRDLGEVSIHTEKRTERGRKSQEPSSEDLHMFRLSHGDKRISPMHSPRREHYGASPIHLVEISNGHVNGSNKSEGKDTSSVLQSLEHDGACNHTGVAAISNGYVAVSDARHKSLQLLNRHSRVLDEITFSYKPCDLASTSDNSLVVTFQDKDFISEYSVRESRFVHQRDLTVSGRGGSYSIAFCKNRFAVCRRGEVRIVSGEDGSLLNVIQIEAHYPQVAMGDGGSKIYLSDFVAGKVHCMTDTGKVRWEYSKDDMEPCSIALDLNQLFVADTNGRVLVLSTLGILVREINCPGQLKAMCFDPSSATLMITQESKNKQTSREIKVVPV